MRIISPRSAEPVEESVDLSGGPTAPPPDGVGPRRSPTRSAVIRGIVVMVVVIALLAGAYLVPLPSVTTARTWSESLGPWFGVLFFLAYAVIPVAPIPRTAFTLAAGVLFPPAVAFVGATISSTIAAALAFWLARRLGRERVRPYLRHPAVAAVEYRLQQRGWLAVGSLRLIAVCPFSLVNYLAGLSSIRATPYLLATVVGMTPGNAAVIFLGDALAGSGSPVSLLLSAGLFAVGVVGLIVDTRLPVANQQA
ncbi:TVP38/TMEM64 family protein [Gordonia sp. (in: high G+C Gram-positive bacteria)]|uniref:TVP38/TMEM64 family protein n=1 Tax=Gordonia sp. (in: high G+C Gram-positive bacteria) TaxID=84139 RepID=UPI003C78CA34